ncbi:MAG: energy-coupling factor ABC transporter permease [Hyphomicrobiaceae bacterium]
MHIEPGVIDAAKLTLSYATAAGAAGVAAKLAFDAIRHGGLMAFGLRAALATSLTFVFFELLPTFSAGVSEVHFILATTLFLVLGLGPTAVGLAGGLAIQSLFFAPDDLPQYAANVTTLLVPLFAMAILANRVIPKETAYKDLGYGQVLALSLAFQGGVVAWVAFWVFYGQGVTAQSLDGVATFGLSYAMVVVVEPIVDLAVLAAAKALHSLRESPLYRTLVNPRLHASA